MGYLILEHPVRVELTKCGFADRTTGRCHGCIGMAVATGLEPVPTESKSVVLPLHHATILVPAEGNAPTRRVDLTDLQSVPPL